MQHRILLLPGPPQQLLADADCFLEASWQRLVKGMVHRDIRIRHLLDGGITPALGVIVNAVADLGVTHIEMPATPERVWRAIRAAAGG